MIIFSGGMSNITAASNAATPAPTPNTNQITKDIIKKLHHWYAAPTINWVKYSGLYAGVSYSTGESGGQAIYKSANSKWNYVCVAKGEFDPPGAEAAPCGIPSHDANILFPVDTSTLPT